MTGSMLNGYKQFLASVFGNISNFGISLLGYELDHIAYRPLTPERYEKRKAELFDLGEMITEVENKGRKISIFRLRTSLRYQQFSISFFELLGPKENNNYPEGFQHIEFVIDCSLGKFMERYPNLVFNTEHINEPINPSVELMFGDKTGVEFHLKDIGEVVKLQGRDI